MPMSRPCLFITLFVVGAGVVMGQTIRYNVGDPTRFGLGYNTLTGEFAGNCTVDVNQGDIKPAGPGDAPPLGQLTSWELSSEQDLTTLSESLDFSASASASFTAGSVSASTQYVRSKTFNKYHEFLYVSAAVANGMEM